MHPNDMRDTQDADAVRDYFRRKGYRPCDIPACNCGGFHGGHAEQRLTEIRELLDEYEGVSGPPGVFGLVTGMLKHVLKQATRWEFVREEFAKKSPQVRRWYFNSSFFGLDDQTIDEAIDEAMK